MLRRGDGRASEAEGGVHDGLKIGVFWRFEHLSRTDFAP